MELPGNIFLLVLYATDGNILLPVLLIWWFTDMDGDKEILGASTFTDMDWYRYRVKFYSWYC